MNSDHLNTEEYHPYYKSYIDKATSQDIVEGLTSNLKNIVEFLQSIPEEKYNYAYAEGKWTVKDVLLHLIDTERIFAYRVLRISRGDTTPLAGFEQDDYVINGNAKGRSFESLIDEYRAVRTASITLFSGLNKDDLGNIGNASNTSISARALGYIITGHENHHIEVIKSRYL